MKLFESKLINKNYEIISGDITKAVNIKEYVSHLNSNILHTLKLDRNLYAVACYCYYI